MSNADDPQGAMPVLTVRDLLLEVRADVALEFVHGYWTYAR